MASRPVNVGLLEVPYTLPMYMLYWMSPTLVTAPHYICSISLYYCFCQAYLLGLLCSLPMHYTRLYVGFNRNSLAARVLGAFMGFPVLRFFVVVVPSAPLESLKVSMQPLLDRFYLDLAILLLTPDKLCCLPRACSLVGGAPSP